MAEYNFLSCFHGNLFDQSTLPIFTNILFHASMEIYLTDPLYPFSLTFYCQGKLIPNSNYFLVMECWNLLIIFWWLNLQPPGTRGTWRCNKGKGRLQWKATSWGTLGCVRIGQNCNHFSSRQCGNVAFAPFPNRYLCFQIMLDFFNNNLDILLKNRVLHSELSAWLPILIC